MAHIRKGGDLTGELQAISHCKCEPVAGAEDLLGKFISVFSVGDNLPNNFNTLHTEWVCDFFLLLKSRAQILQ